MMRMLIVLVYFLVAWQSCAHAPLIPPPQQSDAGAADVAMSDAGNVDVDNVYVSTCSHLATIGCADGKASNCASILQKMVEGHLTTFNFACLNSARDVTSARKCGGVKCTTPP